VIVLDAGVLIAHLDERDALHARAVEILLKGRAQNRVSEEIDVVGIGRNRAAVIGECKWTGKPLSVSILAALKDFKLPALIQSGLRPVSKVEIMLVSRAGFADGLTSAAARDPQLTPVSRDVLVAGL
jgi:hypothetical protein